jgi:hypothetical protein
MTLALLHLPMGGSGIEFELKKLPRKRACVLPSELFAYTILGRCPELHHQYHHDRMAVSSLSLPH